MLIAMAGLPGTGKSTLARGLAAALPAVVLDKDPIRAALFPPTEVEYSTRQDDFCMSLMLQVAAYMVERDAARRVILDGRPFARRYQRAMVEDAARRLGTELRLIVCSCADEIARRRLEQDAATGAHPAHNRSYDLYLSLKCQWEPIDGPALTVDTGAPYRDCLAQCMAYIRSPGRESPAE